MLTYALNSTADAKKFRVCQETRRVIQDAFKIPDLVWAHYLDNANGYFGCEATDDLGTFDGFSKTFEQGVETEC